MAYYSAQSFKRALLPLFLLTYLLIVALGCGGSGSDTPSAVGTNNPCDTIGGKILGGESCLPGSPTAGSPVVRLEIVDLLGQQGGCSGVVVSPTQILSAAHCFQNGVAGLQIFTVFGAHDPKQLVSHPGFRVEQATAAYFNDIALIAVNDPLPVASFSLLTSRAVLVGEPAVVAGYGRSLSGGSLTGESLSGGSLSGGSLSGDFGQLQAGEVVISSVTENHLATNYTGDSANPCLGDSGGPLLVYTPAGVALAGLVSTGRADHPDCGRGDTTLYTNLQSPAVKQFLLSQQVSATYR